MNPTMKPRGIQYETHRESNEKPNGNPIGKPMGDQWDSKGIIISQSMFEIK